MNLYFVRHGESEANVLKVFSNRGLKHGLTEKGKEQAGILAEKLKDIKFDAIYTSPILRAIETSRILSVKFGIDYIVSDELAEFDVGILEGKSDDVSWNRHSNLFNEWLIEGKWDIKVEEGESFNDIKNRFLPFIEKLIATYPNESNILLIGHGGTYRCIFPLILSNIDFLYSYEHHIGNTEYVLAKTIEGKLRCIKWGENMFAAI